MLLSQITTTDGRRAVIVRSGTEAHEVESVDSTRELALAVGEQGRVHGLDLSEPMLALAGTRCAGLPAVELAVGDPTETGYARTWRLIFDVAPTSDEPADVRAFLQTRNGRRLTEVWTAQIFADRAT